MSIHVALNHVTHYRYDRLVSLGPQVVRLRPAPHCRTRILLFAEGSPTSTSSTGSRTRRRTTSRGSCFPDKTNELRIEVDLVAEMAVHQPVRFLSRALRRDFPFDYRGPSNKRARALLSSAAGHAAVRALPGRDSARAATHASTFSSRLNQQLPQRHQLSDPHGARRADAGANAREGFGLVPRLRLGCSCSCCATWAWRRASSPAI